jgi:hypothetical protein
MIGEEFSEPVQDYQLLKKIFAPDLLLIFWTTLYQLQRLTDIFCSAEWNRKVIMNNA